MIAGLLLHMADPEDPVDRRAAWTSPDVRRALQKKPQGTAKPPAAAAVRAAAQRWRWAAGSARVSIRNARQAAWTSRDVCRALQKKPQGNAKPPAAAVVRAAAQRRRWAAGSARVSIRNTRQTTWTSPDVRRALQKKPQGTAKPPAAAAVRAAAQRWRWAAGSARVSIRNARQAAWTSRDVRRALQKKPQGNAKPPIAAAVRAAAQRWRWEAGPARVSIRNARQTAVQAAHMM